MRERGFMFTYYLNVCHVDKCVLEMIYVRYDGYDSSQGYVPINVSFKTCLLFRYLGLCLTLNFSAECIWYLRTFLRIKFPHL